MKKQFLSLILLGVLTLCMATSARAADEWPVVEGDSLVYVFHEVEGVSNDIEDEQNGEYEISATLTYGIIAINGTNITFSIDYTNVSYSADYDNPSADAYMEAGLEDLYGDLEETYEEDTVEGYIYGFFSPAVVYGATQWATKQVVFTEMYDNIVENNEIDLVNTLESENCTDIDVSVSGSSYETGYDITVDISYTDEYGEDITIYAHEYLEYSDDGILQVYESEYEVVAETFGEYSQESMGIPVPITGDDDIAEEDGGFKIPGYPVALLLGLCALTTFGIFKRLKRRQ